MKLVILSGIFLSSAFSAGGVLLCSSIDSLAELSLQEMRGISGGCNNHKCIDCQASGNCGSQVNGCVDATTRCGDPNTKYENLDQKCKSSADSEDSQGPCGETEKQNCYKFKVCLCNMPAGGGWSCEATGPWITIQETWDFTICDNP